MTLRQVAELLRKLLLSDDTGKEFPAGEVVGSVDQDILELLSKTAGKAGYI